MCGICGIVKFDAAASVEPWLLERMTSALAHRGPDASGYFLDGSVGLGHRRLSIIDLSGGNQPIFNEDRSAAIIFNGEIYNYADLTDDLKSRGHRFATHSDTETILHAYEERGTRCVEALRGMFAFAIWDANSRVLFAARDRLGIKPFYYYYGNQFFAFASELKSLLEIPEVPRELDEEALDSYLSLRYVPGPRTLFKSIYKLQPGHLLTLANRNMRIAQYWDLPLNETREVDLDEAVEEYSELLEESVRLRLIAEVPLGVFLSGGIDSSTILAKMSRITNRKSIKTFSVGYEAADNDVEQSNEFYYARIAADAYGAEHHEYRVGAQEFCDAIPALVWHLDEPLADPSCIPLYFISRMAREQITVVLSGEGADETLAGYGIYEKMLKIERFRKVFGRLGSRLAAGLGRRFPNHTLSHYLESAERKLEDRYSGVSRAFYPNDKRDLLGEGRRRNAARESFAKYWQAARSRGALDQMLYLDTKVWLPDDILLKADKMSMAHSLELRVPFLDHKLVEFTAKLPATFKLRGGTGKFLLREAMRNQLPSAILTRPKKGFPVPIDQWLRGELKEFTRETLLSTRSVCRQFFNTNVISRLLDEHEKQVTKRHQEIWTLLMFESWNRTFKNSPRPAQRAPRQEQIGVADVA